MSKPPVREWIGTSPISCDCCSRLIQATFVDGRTKKGPWAIMCLSCHKTHGLGLGTGSGQRYAKSGASFVKVKG